MTKQQARERLADELSALAALVIAADDESPSSLNKLRGICTNRSYVGPQLEVGREELAVILADDDDDK